MTINSPEDRTCMNQLFKLGSNLNEDNGTEKKYQARLVNGQRTTVEKIGKLVPYVLLIKQQYKICYCIPGILYQYGLESSKDTIIEFGEHKVDVSTDPAAQQLICYSFIFL